MDQDFTRRVTIVVDKDLPSWQVLNTVAHIAAYFGNLMDYQFSTGMHFTTKDAHKLPRNSQFPIIILSATSEQLRPLAAKIREAKSVESMFFAHEMIETTDDTEITRQLAAKDADAINYLGVGVFGGNEQVKSLTRGFRLWGS